VSESFFASAFAILFDFIKYVANWLLTGLGWLIGKVFFFLLDGVLVVIEGFFKAIDFSAFAATHALDWAHAPTQLIWFVNAVGLPQGIAMLSGAIAIRMVINLIPAEFTRA
jgi:hypothetical protein